MYSSHLYDIIKTESFKEFKMEINNSNHPDFASFEGHAREYLSLMQLYRSAIKEIQTKLEILDEEFKVRYDHNPIHNIESRLKTPQSIIEKLRRKGLPLNIDSVKAELYDIAGIRVICNYADDIYQIANLLTSQDDIKLISVKDYIKEPKPNGYRSLHLVVEIPIFLAESTERVACEVQIRTIAMDFWASLEHKLKYKREESVSKELSDRLYKCADIIAKIDCEMQDIHKEIQKGQK